MLKKIIIFISKTDLILITYLLILSTYSLLILWNTSEKNTNLIYHRLIHILISIFILLITSQINTYFYEKYIYILYIICNLTLILVNIFGHINKGAQRWINIGLIQFQPSEIIKIILPITISKITNQNYFKYNILILISIISILIPSILVLIQPDLGTSILILISGITILIIKKLKKNTIILLIIITCTLIPPIWKFILHDYQKERILILFNKKKQLINKKYHLIQSKTAIGSGGLYGKFNYKNTQSKLNFIPEKKTDFIFAVIAEETGLIGIYILLLTYILLIYRSLNIIKNTKNRFEKELGLSLIINFFLHIFINISMVNGLLPVVGITLPFISYGGSSLISNMLIFGIIMSIKNKKIQKNIQKFKK